MSDAALQQDIGALKAEVRHLNATIDRMAEAMDAMSTKMGDMKEKMDRVEGGRAALWGLLAAAGTLGGVVVGVASFVLQHVWPR